MEDHGLCHLGQTVLGARAVPPEGRPVETRLVLDTVNSLYGLFRETEPEVPTVDPKEPSKEQR